MNFLLDIWTIIRTDPKEVRGVCYLPAPPPRKAKRKEPERVASIYDIDKDRKFFGFHMDDPANREGATKWCTEYDIEALKDRQIWGGKKVVSQNETCKSLWYAGESVADTARTMGLSGSWVEKRFGAFSAALSEEKGVKAD
jgi:hypothetical protein